MRHYILIQRVITKTALYAFLSQEYRVFNNNPFLMDFIYKNPL